MNVMYIIIYSHRYFIVLTYECVSIILYKLKSRQKLNFNISVMYKSLEDGFDISISLRKNLLINISIIAFLFIIIPNLSL